MMTNDGRYGLRSPAELPAWLLRKGRYISLTVTDIGEHGAFMRGAHASVSLHELVQIVLDLDGRVTVHGVVAHIVPDNDPEGRRAGFGVKLIGTTAGFSAAWREAAMRAGPGGAPAGGHEQPVPEPSSLRS